MEVFPGIRRIRLPMVNNPLRYINSYLIEDGDGYAMVDCGWNTPDVLEALQAELKGVGVRLEEIHTLVVTHFHTDHYGLADRLARLAPLRLLMHRVDWHFVRLLLADFEGANDAQAAWLGRNGLPARVWSDEDVRTLATLRRLSLVPPDVELEDSDQVEIGGSSWRAVWTPGHTPGHICLYDAGRRLLISGDHVLNPITPTVNLSRPDMGNPLRDYRASLAKVAALEVDLVLPAHGEPFAGLRRRVDEILKHHDLREASALAALSDGPATGADVAGHLSWTRHSLTFGQLPPIQQRMALSETLAHLEYLRLDGQVSSRPQNGRILYERVSSPEEGLRAGGGSARVRC